MALVKWVAKNGASYLVRGHQEIALKIVLVLSKKMTPTEHSGQSALVRLNDDYKRLITR